MAKNQKLYDLGIKVFKELLARDKKPENIINFVEVHTDDEVRIRLRLFNLFFYAYDFEREGIKEAYENAVETTKKLSGHPNFETYMADGIVPREGRFQIDDIGWYLTRLD